MYGFANGDPVNFSDPFGLAICPPMCGGFQGMVEQWARDVGAGAKAWAKERAADAQAFWAEHGDQVIMVAGTIAQARGGGGRMGLRPDARAVGPHSTFRTGPGGKVTTYETWQPQSNPRNPAPWESVMRFDGQGGDHFNKATQQRVPTPHVHDPRAPGGVRPARPNEIPK
ncbi:MAG: hypothetical protein ACT4OZ_05420 [Gemmatimonadota bacterium]